MTQPLNERQVQLGLFLGCASRYQVMVPNYTPKQWWECDLFGISKSGMFHEFEIKLTRSDLLADASKSRTSWFDDTGRLTERTEKSKHSLLDSRSSNGPSRFYYVVPKDLVAPIEVPEWAGLQYATAWHSEWVNFQTVKQAPKLHTTPCSEAIARHAMSVCYWRFWKEVRRVSKLSKKMEAAL